MVENSHTHKGNAAIHVTNVTCHVSYKISLFSMIIQTLQKCIINFGKRGSDNILISLSCKNIHLITKRTERFFLFNQSYLTTISISHGKRLFKCKWLDLNNSIFSLKKCLLSRLFELKKRNTTKMDEYCLCTFIHLFSEILNAKGGVKRKI